jgi:hypothetical protein
MLIIVDLVTKDSSKVKPTKKKKKHKTSTKGKENLLSKGKFPTFKPKTYRKGPPNSLGD